MYVSIFFVLPLECVYTGHSPHRLSLSHRSPSMGCVFLPPTPNFSSKIYLFQEKSL